MAEKGLTKQEANLKLKKFGANEIKDLSKINPFKILLRQVKNNFVLYLLFIAMIISFFVGKSITAYTILVVILMVIIVGFVQEYKAERAINALKNMLVPVSIVIRDGKEQEIKSSEIVPDDILILRTGDKIPADCILLDVRDLRVDESILTGESLDVKKEVNSGSNYDEKSQAFMGTYVVNGRGIAKVTHTGMNTRFGKIANLISATEKELPLQKKVNKIAKYMVVLATMISVFTGIIMLLRTPVLNEEVVLNILILVIALGVSAFPEGFPVVLITTLASGARKMAKKNAIVNRMSIIETLGETTVICSDKTGTITKGEMTVKKIFTDNKFFNVTGVGYSGQGDILYNNKKVNIVKERTLEQLIMGSVLCNNTLIERIGENLGYKVLGSPTEAALLILGAKAKIFKDDQNYALIQEMPFSSERKRMSVFCKIGDENIVYSKGAPEYILDKCKFIFTSRGVTKLTALDKKNILENNSTMTTTGLRTMAFAYKKANLVNRKTFEEDLIFIGLVGMEDPPREEVKGAISQCYSAGIKVKMITGDNKETARAIANEIGLHGALIDGVELDTFSDEELEQKINSIAIFARVRPEHKLRIVNALKKNGEIVTMTGDGVNDAPALKDAHVGIAMGEKGTDVSRSVADLTLKDDNFNTIVSAISEGRTIFKNIRKFAVYQLSCNLSELLILFIGVLLGPFLGWQIPLLLALQILFMNLVTDNLPAITLGLNPTSYDAMRDAPRRNSEILTKPFIFVLIFTAFILVLLVLSSYYLSYNVFWENTAYSRTVALFVLICLEIVSAFNFRSFRKPILNRSIFVNSYLVIASLISLGLTFVIIYTPMNKIFETVPLKLDGFIIAIFVSLVFIILFDLLKYLNNKYRFIDLDHS